MQRFRGMSAKVAQDICLWQPGITRPGSYNILNIVRHPVQQHWLAYAAGVANTGPESAT